MRPRLLCSSSVFSVFVSAFVLLTASAAHADGGSGLTAFEPSTFVQGITLLFGVATLVTGSAALFGNLGWSLLIDTGTYASSGETAVRAVNVRGWGVRQVATGVTLWAALLLGDHVLFQVGLASVVIRQVLDIIANLLDGTPKRIPPYLVLGALAVTALLRVL